MSHVSIQDIESFNVVGRLDRPILAGGTTFQVRGDVSSLTAGVEVLTASGTKTFFGQFWYEAAL